MSTSTIHYFNNLWVCNKLLAVFYGHVNCHRFGVDYKVTSLTGLPFYGGPVLVPSDPSTIDLFTCGFGLKE
jgi:hypothetical protein